VFVGRVAGNKENGDWFIWLDHATVSKLNALRGPGQGYSDVTIRVAKGDRNKDSTAGLFVWRA
jgi:hypothetical protein